MNSKCDGETFFGMTVKPCECSATVHWRESDHEEYFFCATHLYYYKHGHYPDDTEKKKTCRYCTHQVNDVPPYGI